MAVAPHLLAARLTAQRLAGPPLADALQATRHLLAIQAQDLRGARLAVRARSQVTHATDVDRALGERALVVTWANRGTLHLVAAEDEPWLHALTAPRLVAANARRLHQEGVTPAAAERGVAEIIRALAARGPLRRDELRAALDAARVPTAGQAMVHLLLRATIEGHIVRGPVSGNEQAFVLVADWLPKRPEIDRAAALAELARRYLQAHGPAAVQDLAAWAGVTLGDARAGLSAIAPAVIEYPGGLVDVRRPEPEPIPPPRLLGPFEPLLHGWRDRGFVLGDAEHRVIRQGMFRAIVLAGGRAIGTWTMPGGEVELALWARPGAGVVAALAREADAVARYLSPR